MTTDSPSLIHAIRGPVLLITLGALFAFEYSGGWPFHRTWPLLLIVFGVLKLAERAAVRSHHEYEPGPPFPGGSA